MNGAAAAEPAGDARLRTHSARQLAVIRRLEENWDLAGAARPGPAALDDAETLLARYAALVPASSVSRPPAPRIEATRGGRVQFEWECGPRCFEATVPGDGSVWLFYEDTDAKVSREWDVPLVEAPAVVREHAERVFG